MLALLLVSDLARAQTPAAPANPPIASVEGKQDIAISGDVPSDGKLVRNLRIARAAPGGPLTLKFLPGDLVSDAGDRIERSAVAFAAVPAFGTDPQDVRVDISGITRPGDYKGLVELRAVELAGRSQSLPITLSIRAAQPLVLSPDTPKLTLQIASPCDGLTRLVLGEHGCPMKVSVATTGAARSGQPPEIDLMLVDGNGSALSKDIAPAVKPDGNLLTLILPSKPLAAGHYSGHIRASYDLGATQILAPVEIDMRWSAWWAIVPIMVGILLGWLWAFMLRTGNDLAAAIDRLSRNESYAAQISDEAGGAIKQSSGPIWALLNDQQAARAKAALDLQDSCIAALRELAHIRASRDLDAGLEAKATALVAAAAANLPDECTTLLTDLRLAPLKGAPANFASVRDMVDRVQRIAAVQGPTFKTWFMSKGLKWVIWAILLSGLTWAGLWTLYVVNGAKFGASPLADFLTLVAWGVTADVSSRTIATFKGPTPC